MTIRFHFSIVAKQVFELHYIRTNEGAANDRPAYLAGQTANFA
ncbi:hypothetical protein [Sporosarcina ureae]|nr:hypothetical protein [Sporosarcina ureae]